VGGTPTACKTPAFSREKGQPPGSSLKRLKKVTGNQPRGPWERKGASPEDIHSALQLPYGDFIQLLRSAFMVSGG